MYGVKKSKFQLNLPLNVVDIAYCVKAIRVDAINNNS